LQLGQREGGWIIDSPLGIRRIQTLRKLPTIAPKINTTRKEVREIPAMIHYRNNLIPET